VKIPKPSKDKAEPSDGRPIIEIARREGVIIAA